MGLETETWSEWSWSRDHFLRDPVSVHGRRMGGESPLDFENFSKKGFLSFEWDKQNFTTFDPLGKILEKTPSTPLKKILPTPMS